MSNPLDTLPDPLATDTQLNVSHSFQHDTSNGKLRQIDSRTVDIRDWYVSGEYSTAINAAITQAHSTLGGGFVDLGPAGSLDISQTIILQNDVLVNQRPGVTVTWQGASGGTMVSNDTATSLQRSGWLSRGYMDCNNLAGKVFDIHSQAECEFGGLMRITNGTADTTVFNWEADAAAAGAHGNKNGVWTIIHPFFVYDACKTITRFNGQTGAPVTLLKFEYIEAYDYRGSAFDFVQRCDNIRIDWVRAASRSDNTTFATMNSSATPLVDLGINANQFGYVGMDTFGTHTGRQGFVFNYSAGTTIDWLNNTPSIENSATALFVQNSTQASWEVRGGYTGDPAQGDNSLHGPNLHYIEKHGHNINWIRTDIKTTSDDSTIPAVLQAANIANGGAAKFQFSGRTSDGTLISGTLNSNANAGFVTLGSISSHPILFIYANSEQLRMDGNGIKLKNGFRFIDGSGSPEGVVTAGMPSIYGDTATGDIYRKTTSGGNTGWVKWTP